MQITVVGGTYREYCVEPAIDRLVGSGLRAAGLLASLGDNVSFVTAIDDESAPELAAVCAALGVDGRHTSRSGAIAFTYETPIHRTKQHGTATAEPLQVHREAVLAFGMVETTWTLQADTLVIDPQHSTVDALLDAASARRTALILNEHEARSATGVSDVEQAARDLLSRGVQVVVVKRGALGGIVAHEDAVSGFGAVATEVVHPLGSGDAFSAGYCHAWSGGADPFEAAQFGSQTAAAHSVAGIPQLRAGFLDDLTEPLPYPQIAPKIYLAGPFFGVAERQLIRTVRSALIHLGADVFSPLDEIGPGGDEVAQKDLEGLSACHGVLAVLDGGDPGTLFEVGWATRAGIPVVGLADRPADHAWTMLRGTGTFVTSDLSSALYNSAWAAIRAQVSA
jgi:nucleoside 2-deoxyribosyltransferase